MLTEDGFLAKLLELPSDDAVRLVYADWLDEQGDPVSIAKAEFLRLTVQLASALPRRRKQLLGEELQQRAATLDTDWLAVVSRLPIENCQGKAAAEKSRVRNVLRQFHFVCDRRWEDLNATEDRAVRFCAACGHNVHYCDTIMEARHHAEQGHCIAVDAGVIRRDRDLEPRLLVLGMPNPSFYREEEERLKPDPVSAERERRKRKNKSRETPASDA